MGCGLRRTPRIFAPAKEVVQGLRAIGHHMDAILEAGELEGFQGQFHVIHVILHQQDIHKITLQTFQVDSFGFPMLQVHGEQGRYRDFQSMGQPDDGF